MTMRIERINNGIVLDHIKAGMGIHILKLFEVELLHTKIDYASYIDSPSLGMKDIIKIENLDVDPKMLMKMALLAPDITISFIRDGHVDKKVKPEVPPLVEGVINCPNPKCITQQEVYLTSRFQVAFEEDGRLRQQCLFCEHIFYS
ncbi:MAG: aspartate carbamoyltransferase regulatory subunit [Acidobacteriota bacterium]|nr:aspartate carbamoyltransferase regulatory subunit [Acidobacteriota bacterium]